LATVPAIVLTNSGATSAWFSIEVVAESDGIAQPAWQSVPPLGQATVTVSAVDYYEIDQLLIADQHVPDAPGKTSYSLIVGPIATDVLVRASFRPTRTVQGVPYAWLSGNQLTNGTPDELAAADQDGDGMATWQEFIADSSPTNRHSVFAIETPDTYVTNAGVFISWPSSSGRRYHVEVSHELSANVWYLAATNLLATPPVNHLVLPVDDRPTAVRVSVKME
jgi:hypothetical protein